MTASKSGEWKETTKTVYLEVKKCDQIIDWENPNDITYGAALDETQLNAKRTFGDGKLTYRPADHTVLNAGKHILEVTAAGTDNFIETTVSVSIRVLRAKQQIKWKIPEPITYGEVLGAKQLCAVRVIGEGELTYDPAKGKLNAGEHTLSVTAEETGNYQKATEQVVLEVQKARQVVVWNPAPIDLFAQAGPDQNNAILTGGNGKTFCRVKHGQKPSQKPRVLQLMVPETANFMPCLLESQCDIIDTGIKVSAWMECLGFQRKTNLYMMGLGKFTGASQQLIEKGKAYHLSIFKSQLPNRIIPTFCSAVSIRDILFPEDDELGFHITIECNSDRMKNPHVYRGLDEIFHGRGIKHSTKEWIALKKKLTRILNEKLKELYTAILKANRKELYRK